jgi:spermidine synthase
VKRPEQEPRRRGPGAATALAATAFLTLALGYALVTQRSATIFEAESPFGRVRVVEGPDGLRSLYVGDGRARQSAIYPGRPTHLESAYARVAMAGLALAPRDPRLLFVGLGGGAMPMYVRHVLADARIDVVEIDPLIVDVAVRFFTFTPDTLLAVHVADGREFIEGAPPTSWDVVFLDAFSDDEIPFALTTREFLESVRRSLATGGLVVSNLWTSNPAHDSMVATYQATFDDVALIDVADRTQTVLVAAPGPGRLGRGALLEAARALAERVDLGFDLRGLIVEGHRRAPSPAAPVLRDSL